MAEKTGISWTTSTFNPWIGCTKVSPGCDHCYAEALDARHQWKGATHWGAGVPRMRTSDANWLAPHRWNKKQEGLFSQHALGKIPKPARWLVFCASLADVFDNEVPEQWRDDLFALIRATPYLTWLLLTKRIGNAEEMLARGLKGTPFFPNVWLGASVVNQLEADRDLPKLLATPALKRFVSYEPALGPVDFSSWLWPVHAHWPARFCSPEDALAAGAQVDYKPQGLVSARARFIDWIIVGGESAQNAPARPFHTDWARRVVLQCQRAQTAAFVKQLGAKALTREIGAGEHSVPIAMLLKDRAGGEPLEWPADLRVQEFPK